MNFDISPPSAWLVRESPSSEFHGCFPDPARSARERAAGGDSRQLAGNHTTATRKLMSAAYPPIAGLPREQPPRTRMAVVAVVVTLVLGPVLLYWSRGEVAKWYRAAARQGMLTGDWDLALRNNERAAAWDPSNPEIWLEQSELYLHRADAVNAVSAAEKALEITRAASEQRSDTGLLINALNSVAYSRALARSDLARGLTLVEEALQLAGDLEVPGILDTRGYLHYLNGNYDQALADCESAVSSVERSYKQQLHEVRQEAQAFVDKLPFEAGQRRITEGLAVLYQHRGLALQATGNEEAATADFARADEFGYDPEHGVW